MSWPLATAKRQVLYWLISKPVTLCHFFEKRFTTSKSNVVKLDVLAGSLVSKSARRPLYEGSRLHSVRIWSSAVFGSPSRPMSLKATGVLYADVGIAVFSSE